MLSELIVEGLGVIDRAEISFGPGCSVLTGETGAGKTLVVAALQLLLGERADRALVRSGFDKARVEARFTVGSGEWVAGRLGEAGLLEPAGDSDAEIIIARSVSTDGRSSARLNGRMVTASLLSEIAPYLVEVAGQHEHQSLTGTRAQRDALDDFAGPAAVELASEVASAVTEANGARRALDELTESEQARRREIDVLDYEIAEIQGASITAGESTALAEQVTRLENAEAISAAVASTLSALAEEGGAEDGLARAVAALRAATGMDGALEPLVRRLEAVSIDLQDVREELAARPVALEDDSALTEVRERLDVLSRLRRKYGRDETEILAYLERARSRREELESTAADAQILSERYEEAAARASNAAGRLRALRTEAAPRLERAVEDVLSELAMGQARFSVSLKERPMSESGTESIEFRVAANPGEALRPLARVASGGELSRVALALHLLTSGGTAPTMVFDEVDAAVGGQAAQAVGRLLMQLAARPGVQVVVVTHLPQVAAHADAHYAVSKATRGGRTSASVQRVEGDRRVEELSRMLAGLPESRRAKEHARELLEIAEAKR